MNTKLHFSTKTGEWSTPDELFDMLNVLHNFDLDVCATPDNAKCVQYYTKEDNAFHKVWHRDGKRIWMNPPYGRKIIDWVRKAYIEAQHDCVVVCLLPARTDTKWFHDLCTHGDITFLRGRLKFGNSKNSAPFPSMIVVFGERTE